MEKTLTRVACGEGSARELGAETIPGCIEQGKRNMSVVLAKFTGNVPADEEPIRLAEVECRLTLPEDYKKFLRSQNGSEGFIGNSYAMLWSAEKLREMNRSYNVNEYAPGLLLFGSDGGGEAFAFDTGSDVKPVVTVQFVGMEFKVVLSIALTFSEFLEVLFKP